MSRSRSPDIASAVSAPRQVRLALRDVQVGLTTDSGVFSPAAVDGAKVKAGTVSRDKLREIATAKMKDLNAVDVDAAIRMIESGVLPMDKICTHQLPLAEFQKGLDLVSSGTESVKVSLIP